MPKEPKDRGTEPKVLDTELQRHTAVSRRETSLAARQGTGLQTGHPAIRMRALVLAAADSTIEQTIRLKTNHLTPAVNDDGIEKLIEELRAKAILEIDRMNAERNEYGDSKPRKPN
jgi:hypothetical protein